MIQRIQSVYLLLITVLMMLPLFVPIAQIVLPGVPLHDFYVYGVVQEGGEVVAYYWLLLLAVALGIGIPFVTIFLYRKRGLQLRLCLVEIILCIVTFLLMWYDVSRFGKTLEGGVLYKFSFILPLICVILGYLAARGIIKDINLIKSYDRIR